MEHFLFAHQLGATFTAYGYGKDQRLRDYLKKIVLSRKNIPSLAGMEVDLDKAHHAGNIGEIRKISQKLLTMGKESPQILRMLAISCNYAHQFKKSLFYLNMNLSPYFVFFIIITTIYSIN